MTDNKKDQGQRPSSPSPRRPSTPTPNRRTPFTNEPERRSVDRNTAIEIKPPKK